MISAMPSAIMTMERKQECPLPFPGKKPYIFVGLVCVREQYQGQGYMRKVLNFAFAEGDRLGVPVILETDAQSKCDKYVHLGMELVGTHDLGAFGKLYDLIRYPESSNENGTT